MSQRRNLEGSRRRHVVIIHLTKKKSSPQEVNVNTASETYMLLSYTTQTFVTCLTNQSTSGPRTEG